MTTTLINHIEPLDAELGKINATIREIISNSGSGIKFINVNFKYVGNSLISYCDPPSIFKTKTDTAIADVKYTFQPFDEVMKDDPAVAIKISLLSTYLLGNEYLKSLLSHLVKENFKFPSDDDFSIHFYERLFLISNNEFTIQEVDGKNITKRVKPVAIKMPTKSSHESIQDKRFYKSYFQTEQEYITFLFSDPDYEYIIEEYQLKE